MRGPVCPSCGVAVLPGYVRCPKCRKPLPRRKSTIVEGGTAVENTSKTGLVVVLGALIVGAVVVAYLGLRHSDKPAAPAPVASPTQETEQTAPTESQNGPVEDNSPSAAPTATRPDPGIAAERLRKELDRQRLWSTVSVEGARVDVRSGSCSDPKMGPLLDGAAAGFKAAGLTKLRCLEQSGSVVTDRDL